MATQTLSKKFVAIFCWCVGAYYIMLLTSLFWMRYGKEMVKKLMNRMTGNAEIDIESTTSFTEAMTNSLQIFVNAIRSLPGTIRLIPETFRSYAANMQRITNAIGVLIFIFGCIINLLCYAANAMSVSDKNDGYIISICVLYYLTKSIYSILILLILKGAFIGSSFDVTRIPLKVCIIVLFGLIECIIELALYFLDKKNIELGGRIFIDLSGFIILGIDCIICYRFIAYYAIQALRKLNNESENLTPQKTRKIRQFMRRWNYGNIVSFTVIGLFDIISTVTLITGYRNLALDGIFHTVVIGVVNYCHLSYLHKNKGLCCLCRIRIRSESSNVN